MTELGKRYTLEEVAKFLGVHHATLRRFVKEGRIRATRHGRNIVFRTEDILDFEKRESEVLADGDH